jgi:putative intracellular protease/amidase
MSDTAAKAAETQSTATASTAPATPGTARRVLVVGDSTAMTLAWALSQSASSYGATLLDGSTFMCGVAIGSEASSEDGHGPTMAMVPACNSATPVSQQWPALWRSDIARYDPQVVVVLAGRWETTDRTYEGRWMDILDRPFAAYVERQLRLAVEVGTSRGAHVDLLTSACADSAPYFASEHLPDTAVDDDSPARLAVYNSLVRKAAAGDPRVSVVDFDAIVCPGGKFHRYLDGVQVRPLDGVHTPSYSPGNLFVSNSTPAVAAAFAAWLAPRLWPQILAGAARHSVR